MKVAPLVFGVAIMATPCFADDFKTATYACERGARVLATYVPEGVILTVEGQQVALGQLRSGSGVRFGNTGTSYIWWIKGKSATLDWVAGDNSTRIYDACKTE
ncbi:MliC family protein [Ruegeria hyattellae]|uniref:MliC family protein n=1 Tax=Ruegeria hyattellae TaxID=3233337 RepID=UPI00355AFC2E